MIKAVFFDIDGTLVSFKTHKIPESAIQAIKELRKRGIKVFIATGRPFMAINNLEDIIPDGYITVNGGHCIDENKETIYKNTINKEDIQSLIRYQNEKEKFPCIFVTENEMFINYTNDNVYKILELVDFPIHPIKNIEYASDKEIYQMMAFYNIEDEEKIIREALPNSKPARWNPLFTDIIPIENSKQVGIDKIIEHYGIDINETMSFGDGGNDIPMLRHTKISVAMGNASDDVKKAATYITDSVDENGIFNALKHFKII